jgi:hypothetical protein
MFTRSDVTNCWNIPRIWIWTISSAMCKGQVPQVALFCLSVSLMDVEYPVVENRGQTGRLLGSGDRHEL